MVTPPTDETRPDAVAPRILILEDDDGIAGMLKTILAEKGYEVVHFTDGQQAIEWLSDNAPDIAILDLHVPNQTGFQVMQAIRNKDRATGGYVPVIVLTGIYTSRNDKVTALDTGADDFLSKPFDMLELLARVRSLLRVQELYKRSQFLATHDPLTGCYNRRYLMDFLAREIQRFLRTKSPLSFIMLDMDDFKGINDTHGHEAGDQALIFVASCLRAFFRAVDCVARIGGDEFGVALPGCGPEEAKQAASRLVRFLQSPEGQAHAPTELRGKIHFSAGVATLPERQPDEKHLIQLADQALYAAKKAGPDQFRISA